MGAETSGPERLRVYQLALRFARAIDDLVRARLVRYPLVGQLSRAADSIVLNIGEGAMIRRPKRKILHYEVARGSAGECIAILSRLTPSPRVAAAPRDANMICAIPQSRPGITSNRHDDLIKPHALLHRRPIADVRREE